MKKRCLAVVLTVLTVLCIHPVRGEPAPGDVFREYRMQLDMWRVGQRHEWGGANWGKPLVFATTRHDGGVPHDVDLEGAVRAELQVGYDQCHSGTTGLSVSMNTNEYLRLPVPETIPEPRSGYMHWPFPTINVPLGHLRSGTNSIAFRIDAEPRAEGEGGWFQNLVYPAVLRIYYGPEKPHPTGKMTAPVEDETVGRTVEFAAEVQPGLHPIARVDFLGHYLDFDQDGDGIYQEWQYRYGSQTPPRLEGIAGSVEEAPYAVSWDTSWLPDQKEPMSFAARIEDESGMVYLTPEVRRVRLVRPGYSVELCKPYNVPQGWVTRKDPAAQEFDVEGDPADATAAKVVFRAWGGNDDKGGWVNETYFPHFKEPAFEIPVDALKQGANTLKHEQGGHHGMEICWPGAVVLVRYGEGEE